MSRVGSGFELLGGVTIHFISQNFALSRNEIGLWSRLLNARREMIHECDEKVT
jgi:hypothetical protein